MKSLKIIILCLLVVTSTSANAHPSIFHELINHENLLNLFYTFVFLAITFMIIRRKINYEKKY